MVSRRPSSVSSNVLGVGTGLVLAGALGFVLLEPTVGGWADALYLTMATLTTVGYGDLAPSTGPSKALAAGLGLAGLGFFCGPVLAQTGGWVRGLPGRDKTMNGPGAEDYQLLLGLGLTVGLGSLALVLLEGWPLLEAGYFCVVTGTTIGYGDHPPFRTEQGKLAAAGYMLLGIWCHSAVVQRLGEIVPRLLSYLPTQPLLKALFAPSVDVGVSLVGIGALGFVLLEPTVGGWADALYLTMATLTTVGYGDLAPSTGPSKALAAGLGLAGLGFFCGPVLAQTGGWVRATAGRMPAVVGPAGLAVAVGATVFVLLEGWGVGEAAWFCVVTSSTVGYGDHVFGGKSSVVGQYFGASDVWQDASKLAACFYMLFTITCFEALLGLAADKLMSGFEARGIKLKVKRV